MADAKAKSGSKKVKKEKYREFCEPLNKYVNPSHICNVTKKFKCRCNKVSNCHEYKTEKLDYAKKLTNEICPDWCSPPKPDLTNPDGDLFLEEEFNEEELNFALSMVNLNSLPGIDGIDYTILFRLSNYAKGVMLSILNGMYRRNIFPSQWKQVMVHFVPKPKSDKLRPISLSSCICKVFERMVSNRLTWWLEHFGKLPSNQYGFRRSIL